VAQSLASAAEHSVPRNSAARADLIRDAVRWLAEHEAEVKALNAEIGEYRMKHIKGDLGFKLSDWAAIYRVSQLEVEDRDVLIETVREGFAALGIGQIVDWVDAAQATPGRRGNGATAPDQAARDWGRSDGLGGVHDHAAWYPQGEPGHGDYMLGLADGEAERERVMALGEWQGEFNGTADHDTPALKRGRGRPRKQRQEA
jgi:hypothetical protein